MILSARLNVMQPERKPFVFFDFDGTLTQSDTLMPFLRHCSGSKSYYGKLLKLSPVFLAYFARILPNYLAKERVLTEFLRQMTVQEAEHFATTFVQQVLPHRLLALGMDKLREHQQQGHYCILVSASPELYLRHWAALHQFDGIIGTQLAVVSGHLTGQLWGQNCFGAEKVKRIEAEYGTDCWLNSFAYSDSASDLPMLRCAAQGFLLQQGIFQPLSSFK